MAVTYTVSRLDRVAFSGTLSAASDGIVLANGVKQENLLICEYQKLPALSSVTGTAPAGNGLVVAELEDE